MQADFTSLTMFVWTKIGIEAGESLDEILARKERERLANGGVFLWGVGNNVGSSLRVLANHGAPEILFSPICSAPRNCDEAPDVVFRWTRAETLDGLPFAIPAGSMVTSRGYPRKRFHYAIVCHSTEPLQLNTVGRIYAGSLRNLVSGKRVGSSQVTSVVTRDMTQDSGREYAVTMHLNSQFPYFIRLSAPVFVENSSHQQHPYPGDWTLLNWSHADDLRCKTR